MHHQIEKNKRILWEEMERVGSQKMTPAIAERLAVYRDAYKALHMLCEEDMEPEDRSAPAMLGRTSLCEIPCVKNVSHAQNNEIYSLAFLLCVK